MRNLTMQIARIRLPAPLWAAVDDFVEQLAENNPPGLNCQEVSDGRLLAAIVYRHFLTLAANLQEYGLDATWLMEELEAQMPLMLYQAKEALDKCDLAHYDAA